MVTATKFSVLLFVLCLCGINAKRVINIRNVRTPHAREIRQADNDSDNKELSEAIKIQQINEASRKLLEEAANVKTLVEESESRKTGKNANRTSEGFDLTKNGTQKVAFTVASTKDLKVKKDEIQSVKTINETISVEGDNRKYDVKVKKNGEETTGKPDDVTMTPALAASEGATESSKQNEGKQIIEQPEMKHDKEAEKTDAEKDKMDVVEASKQEDDHNVTTVPIEDILKSALVENVTIENSSDTTNVPLSVVADAENNQKSTKVEQSKTTPVTETIPSVTKSVEMERKDDKANDKDDKPKVADAANAETKKVEKNEQNSETKKKNDGTESEVVDKAKISKNSQRDVENDKAANGNAATKEEAKNGETPAKIRTIRPIAEEKSEKNKKDENAKLENVANTKEAKIAASNDAKDVPKPIIVETSTTANAEKPRITKPEGTEEKTTAKQVETRAVNKKNSDQRIEMEKVITSGDTELTMKKTNDEKNENEELKKGAEKTDKVEEKTVREGRPSEADAKVQKADIAEAKDDRTIDVVKTSEEDKVLPVASKLQEEPKNKEVKELKQDEKNVEDTGKTATDEKAAGILKENENVTEQKNRVMENAEKVVEKDEIMSVEGFVTENPEVAAAESAEVSREKANDVKHQSDDVANKTNENDEVKKPTSEAANGKNKTSEIDESIKNGTANTEIKKPIDAPKISEDKASEGNVTAINPTTEEKDVKKIEKKEHITTVIIKKGSKSTDALNKGSSVDSAESDSTVKV